MNFRTIHEDVNLLTCFAKFCADPSCTQQHHKPQHHLSLSLSNPAPATATLLIPSSTLAQSPELAKTTKPGCHKSAQGWCDLIGFWLPEEARSGHFPLRFGSKLRGEKCTSKRRSVSGACPAAIDTAGSSTAPSPALLLNALEPSPSPPPVEALSPSPPLPASLCLCLRRPPNANSLPTGAPGHHPSSAAWFPGPPVGPWNWEQYLVLAM